MRTSNVMMGKKAGGLSSFTPKYFSARARSNCPYAALAGRVQGGLLPADRYCLSIQIVWSTSRWLAWTYRYRR